MRALLIIIMLAVMGAGLIPLYCNLEKVFGSEEEGRPWPFNKGEKLIYSVYCQGLKIGRSVLTFHGEERMEGKDVYHISFLTELPFFEDSEDIYADKRTFLPLRVSRLIRRMGSLTTRIEEEYDQDNFKVKIKKEKIFSSEEFTIKKEGPIHNPILLTYYYRAKPDILKEGKFKIVLPVADFNVELAGRETLTTSLGRFPVYLISSTPPKFTFYLTADEERIPVKIEGHNGLGYSLIIESRKNSAVFS